MSLSVLFILKEALDGLRRTKFAGVWSTMTVSISLILIGLFLIVTINLEHLVSFLRSRVELEVFLDDSLDEVRISEIEKEISGIPGIKSVEFISKEAALIAFHELFKDRMEDYFATLGYNPLPASFRITLKENNRTVAGAESVAAAIKSLGDVAEGDVEYRSDFLSVIEKNMKLAIAIDLIIGTIVCISSLLLVSHNTRLIILSRDRMIATMKLVGATKNFIQLPLLIQGSAQGFLGGLFTIVFLFLLLKVAVIAVPGLSEVHWQLYLLLVLMGGGFGFVGSFTAVRKHL